MALNREITRPCKGRVISQLVKKTIGFFDKLRQIVANGHNLSLRRADLTRKEPLLGSFHTILLTAVLLCRLF